MEKDLDGKLQGVNKKANSLVTKVNSLDDETKNNSQTLLLTLKALNDGCLTLEDLQQKLNQTQKRFFWPTNQTDTCIESYIGSVMTLVGVTISTTTQSLHKRHILKVSMFSKKQLNANFNLSDTIRAGGK